MKLSKEIAEKYFNIENLKIAWKFINETDYNEYVYEKFKKAMVGFTEFFEIFIKYINKKHSENI